ncbi:MAG: TonB family protein [Bacteroidetes bacterium]|nr:TonB family protein [Bacteroidota bacterium]
MKKLLHTVITMLCLGHLMAQDSTLDIHVRKPETKTEPEESMPQYKGGEPALFRFIEANFVRPRDAQDIQIQGRIVVGMQITAAGVVDSVYILEKLWPTIDAACIRAIWRTQGNWLPGKTGSKTAKFKYKIPVKTLIAGGDSGIALNNLNSRDGEESTAYYDCEAGRYAAALPRLREVCAKDPVNNFAAHNLGLCLFRTGDLAGACTIWRRLRSQDWHTADYLLLRFCDGVK